MKPQLHPLLAELSAYLQEKAGAQREAAVRSGKPVFDFGIGDPREPTPQFIREALKAAVPEVSRSWSTQSRWRSPSSCRA